MEVERRPAPVLLQVETPFVCDGVACAPERLAMCAGCDCPLSQPTPITSNLAPEPGCDACATCDDTCLSPACRACGEKRAKVAQRNARKCKKLIITACQLARHNTFVSGVFFGGRRAFPSLPFQNYSSSGTALP